MNNLIRNNTDFYTDKESITVLENRIKSLIHTITGYEKFILYQRDTIYDLTKIIRDKVSSDNKYQETLSKNTSDITTLKAKFDQLESENRHLKCTIQNYHEIDDQTNNQKVHISDLTDQDQQHIENQSDSFEHLYRISQGLYADQDKHKKHFTDLNRTPEMKKSNDKSHIYSQRVRESKFSIDTDYKQKNMSTDFDIQNTRSDIIREKSLNFNEKQDYQKYKSEVLKESPRKNEIEKKSQTTHEIIGKQDKQFPINTDSDQKIKYSNSDSQSNVSYYSKKFAQSRNLTDYFKISQTTESQNKSQIPHQQTENMDSKINIITDDRQKNKSTDYNYRKVNKHSTNKCTYCSKYCHSLKQCFIKQRNDHKYTQISQSSHDFQLKTDFIFSAYSAEFDKGSVSEKSKNSRLTPRKMHLDAQTFNSNQKTVTKIKRKVCSPENNYATNRNYRKAQYMRSPSKQEITYFEKIGGRYFAKVREHAYSNGINFFKVVDILTKKHRSQKLWWPWDFKLRRPAKSRKDVNAGCRSFFK